VSSTEIPKAILKTSKVDGFKGIPNHPIIPEVKTNGIKFGINEIATILHERKRIAIKTEIDPIANKILETKFATKY
jgi:hypothetical protein